MCDGTLAAPHQTVEKPLGGIGGPQPSDFGSETGGVYVGFGCLAQQGFPYALCRPANRRRVGKERFPSEKIALRRAFLTAGCVPTGTYFFVRKCRNTIDTGMGLWFNIPCFQVYYF